ncbi:glutamate--tRNA ligase [Flavihumibacter petaseus]|uniref:Glutamate--tRNA ligase n=1 Tax=Flavihumibacter petaseus NBRC 106054 TaxID=1220578 RepID=A0A0E9MW55_9BACT|nr:glutamate--tRNA ligase [Flavihumibacter petaseus]GAO41656.1 glutamyl-tRNA synthetase [Flavihumibacter petaseus NBRC 106054]
MSQKIRVRFAPSPTGGLHLGGVRTVLYNYLFARGLGGKFILRIEDTDQSRFVPGAEDYIMDCLRWCGMEPDESPEAGGPFGPYRQSERKPSYRAFAEQLVQSGKAYYAFDTPAELEEMRNRFKTAENPTPQYDHHLRSKMRNSLSMGEDEVRRLIGEGVPYVIRIKMPADEVVSFTDMIRGEVRFNTGIVDDKVLLKQDGMPTYHLAVVVDDHAMEISHAFRGEEWLPSAPVHVLLWEYLGWKNSMPQFAHLPLILKPDGNGKLSKRDGDRLGFPVFAMNWSDPRTGDFTQGFRERGFLPEAFVNLLAMLGWNDGTGTELFSMEELISAFSMDRVHKGGAKFDFEKAKWFNHEWIKRSSADRLLPDVRQHLEAAGITANDDHYTKTVIDLVKERCTLLPDFAEQAGFFFNRPAPPDLQPLAAKWSPEKTTFFRELGPALATLQHWTAADIEACFKDLAQQHSLKVGELQLPLRLLLVGGKFGPAVFSIAATIGREETISRIGAFRMD